MLSFEQMIVRVAEAVGVADYPDGTDNRATIPSDPNTLALVKDAINDGRAAFYAEDSKLKPSGDPGVWQFLRPHVSVTLSTDGTGPACIRGAAYRYKLDAGLAGPSSNQIICELPDGASGGHPVTVTSIDRVRASRAGSPSQTGRPQFAAFAPLDAGQFDLSPRVELQVFPTPDQAYILQIPMRRQWAPLGDLNDYEPSQYPHTVMAFATFELVKGGNIPSGPDRDAAATERDDWLRRARIVESQLSPRTGGVLIAPDRTLTPTRPWVGMTNLFGSPNGATTP
jgi:hypothetical protein